MFSSGARVGAMGGECLGAKIKPSGGRMLVVGLLGREQNAPKYGHDQKKYTGTYAFSNDTEWLDGAGGAGALSIQENKKIYYKLEIAGYDLNSSGTATSASAEYKTWSVAFAQCKALTYASKTGWRLPTIRELSMILLFSDAFEGSGYHPLAARSYFSATEISPDFIHTVNGRSKTISGQSKSTGGYARCVREV